MASQEAADQGLGPQTRARAARARARARRHRRRRLAAGSSSLLATRQDMAQGPQGRGLAGIYSYWAAAGTRSILFAGPRSPLSGCVCRRLRDRVSVFLVCDSGGKKSRIQLPRGGRERSRSRSGSGSGPGSGCRKLESQEGRRASQFTPGEVWVNLMAMARKSR